MRKGANFYGFDRVSCPVSLRGPVAPGAAGPTARAGPLRAGRGHPPPLRAEQRPRGSALCPPALPAPAPAPSLEGGLC